LISVFTIPKPFDGHIELIQRNAITSWTLLDPRPEIILIGDEPGTAEVAEELGLRHVPEVARDEFGTPLVNDAFDKARGAASHDLLAFVNADIILMSDFMKAVASLSGWGRPFLMVGERWWTDIDRPVDFSPRWEDWVRSVPGQRGRRDGMDYLVFTRGVFTSIPPFAIGRLAYDNWLIWAARKRGVAVVDATRVILAVHQGHDHALSSIPGSDDAGQSAKLRPYMYPDRAPEAVANRELAGGWTRLYTLDHATHLLESTGVRPNMRAARLSATLTTWKRRAIDNTRSLRHTLGSHSPHAPR